MKKLQRTFNEIHTLDLEGQKARLLDELAQHQGTAPQRDDITVVGLRF